VYSATVVSFSASAVWSTLAWVFGYPPRCRTRRQWCDSTTKANPEDSRWHGEEVDSRGPGQMTDQQRSPGQGRRFPRTRQISMLPSIAPLPSPTWEAPQERGMCAPHQSWPGSGACMKSRISAGCGLCRCCRHFLAEYRQGSRVPGRRRCRAARLQGRERKAQQQSSAADRKAGKTSTRAIGIHVVSSSCLPSVSNKSGAAVQNCAANGFSTCWRRTGRGKVVPGVGNPRHGVTAEPKRCPI
jgi:hypothetical protein